MLSGRRLQWFCHPDLGLQSNLVIPTEDFSPTGGICDSDEVASPLQAAAIFKAWAIRKYPGGALPNRDMRYLTEIETLHSIRLARACPRLTDSAGISAAADNLPRHGPQRLSRRRKHGGAT